MNESDYNELQEKSWRRKLTDAEEAARRAGLAEHPESGADWETDVRLTEALNRLPEAPVPSNFTARVLQQIERETPEAKRSGPSRWFFRLLLPRIAVAAVVLGVGLFTYHETTVAKRAELVQGVKMVSSVPSLPGPQVMEDFDTIRQLNTTPGPDPELIALMK